MVFKSLGFSTSLLCWGFCSTALAASHNCVKQSSTYRDNFKNSQIASADITPKTEQILAQTPPLPPEILEPNRQKLPPLPSTLPSPTSPPRLDVPETIPSAPATELEAKVKVTRVEVLGNTVFSRQDLEKVLAPFIGKESTFEELLAIRKTITDLYTSNGYTTSGAFLPVQDISDGVIRVQVVEGELEKIEIAGLNRLQPAYVRSRVRLAAKTPVNIRKLEEALQLLQLDPLFTRVQAELKAGTSPGRSILTINLQEAEHFSAAYLVENRDSPSVGSIRHSGIINHDSLLGLGDRFYAEIGFTAGVNSYDFSYEIPVNALNGTFNVRYAKSDQVVIEEPFAPLDLNSNTQTISVGFRQPLIRTPTQEFALGLSGDLRRSQTFLAGNIPFSFSLGPENGESKVTALRFSQDWTKRSSRQILAARSQFSFGLDAFDATVNETGTDARFFSWLGQFQWVQALGTDTVAIARVASQITGDSLLPLEQFSIGGIDTVRGYRQNQRVGDSGVIGSLEVRLPIYKDPNPQGFGLIQVVPFFDIGTVWNNSAEINESDLLMSTGLGLRWQIDNYFSARLDWGIPLKRVERSGDSLQDNGIFFSIRYQPF